VCRRSRDISGSIRSRRCGSVAPATAAAQYPSPLHADLVVPLIGDEMLRDLAAYIEGDIDM
jgi:hypothetical protein